MNVTVDPQRGAGSFDKTVQIGSEGRIERAAAITQRNGPRARRVMRHDNDPLARGLVGLLGDPTDRFRVKAARISRAEPPKGWRHADTLEIRHGRHRGDLGKDDVTVQLEIGPERCAEKENGTNADLIVLQNVNIRAFGKLFKLLSELRNFLAVKLVVAEDINDRLVGKRLANPFDSVLTGVNIACEDDHIRIHLRWFKWRELQVKVAQDVQAHMVNQIDRVKVDVSSASSFSERHPSSRDAHARPC